MPQSHTETRHSEGRPWSMANPPAAFITNFVPLAENSHYVPELDRFVALPEEKIHNAAIQALWKDSIIEQEKLSIALGLLRQKLQKNGSPQTGTLLRNFTWRQVVTEVQEASDAYKNEKGGIKNIFRNFCDNSATFEHWLCLLPGGDYGATISGAFVMTVMAARNMYEVRQIIYETLDNIPDTLAHASTYIEIYKTHSSENLVKRTAMLCKSILKTLHLVVQIFLKSSFKRGMGAMLKGGGFVQDLRESIRDLKEQVINLRVEASVLLQRRVTEMDRKSDLREGREQSRQQLAKEELLLAIDSSTTITAQKVCTYLLRQLQSNPDYDVRTGSRNVSLETVLKGCDGSNPSPEVTPPDRSGPTADDILELLHYNDKIRRKDIKNSLTLGYTQSDDDQARSTWALNSPEMGEFLAGKNQSKFLLINGNGQAAEFISPLSFVCAKILDLIGVSDHIINLSFFCGHHKDDLREPRANVAGMLASFVGQLLMQVKNLGHDGFDPNLSSIAEGESSALQDGDARALFKVFRATVTQLPKDTIIFCLIDSLSVYENSSRSDDTISLMRKLFRLVRKSDGAVLKLLVTCPGQSLYADQWVEFSSRRAQKLHVPEVL